MYTKPVSRQAAVRSLATDALVSGEVVKLLKSIIGRGRGAIFLDMRLDAYRLDLVFRRWSFGLIFV